jgi:hypothetical protein
LPIVNYKRTFVRCSLLSVLDIRGMNVHIGEKIKKRAKELKIGSTELGSLINTTKQNVYGIYKRPTIDVQLLYDISKALKFNFFQYYAIPELNTESKTYKEFTLLKKENEKLKADIRTLKEKNDLLQKINKLLEKGKATK